MSRFRIWGVTVAVVTTVSCALHQSARGEDALLVADGAKVQRLADGFAFTEGPACDKAGSLFFSDVRTSRTHCWSTDGKLTTFRTNTGGGNGQYFDRDGNLLCCEGDARRLTSVAPDGTVTALVDQYEGNRFNAPNDLWIDPAGGVYFTDPRYRRQARGELDRSYVFYLSPDHKTLTPVIDDMKMPNGIIGTADGKLLYVADYGGGKTYVYKIAGPGRLADRRLFAPEGSDGMTLDQRGNVYLTTDAVKVYNPAGELITTIAVPEQPSNVTFGGTDHKTLFVTARTGLYALPMNVRGQ
jgi:gluconolactonase